jgi:hypothetical protein
VKRSGPLSRRALNRATLARQLLLERKKMKPLAAIEKLAGMQAQLPRPPFIGLASRIEGFGREDLVRSIERGDVVRATMMRGTLHFVSRRDYVKLRMALQPMLTLVALRGRTSGIDVDRVVTEAQRFFKEPRTFDEFRKQVRAGDERAIAYTVRMHLPLIQVPADAPYGYSSAAVFKLFEDPIDPPDPQALVLRYLAAFGPASVNDMQTWSGLRGLRESFEALRPKLMTFTDERGKELFDLPKARRPDEDVDAPVRFLPEYDNLLLGHADRTRIVPEEYRNRMFMANLAIPAAFLVDGFVAGTWKIERGKVELEPFGRLSREAKKALEEEAEKLTS